MDRKMIDRKIDEEPNRDRQIEVINGWMNARGDR